MDGRVEGSRLRSGGRSVVAIALAMAMVASSVVAITVTAAPPAHADGDGNLAGAKAFFADIYPEEQYLYLLGTLSHTTFTSKAAAWDWGIWTEVHFPYRYWEVCDGPLRWVVLHPTQGWLISHQVPAGYWITHPPQYSSNAGYRQLRDFHQAVPMPTWPFLHHTPFSSEQDPAYIAERSAAIRSNPAVYVALVERATCELPEPDEPTADCEVTDTPNEPGRFRFDATGSTGEGLVYAWDFGDGNTGTGFLDQHTYTAPGTYTATLEVTDNVDRSATTTCEVEVEANELELWITVGDGEGDVLDPDDEVEVHVRARVTDDALGDFAAVAFDGDPLRFPAERFDVVEEPDLPDGPLALAAGDDLELTWTLAPAAPGIVTFRSTVDALDPLDEPVTVEAERTVRIGDLVEVEVALEPDTISLNKTIDDQIAEGGDGGAEPVEVVATVTVTNGGEDEVTGFVWPGAVDIVGTDNATVGYIRARATGGPRLPGGAVGPVDPGPFTLDGGQQRTVEYTLEVLHDGTFEVRALVQYDDALGGAPLFARGTAELRSEQETPLGMTLTTPYGQQLDWLDAGELVPITGDIYNLSSTDRVEVDLASMVPTGERNAIVLPLRPLDHPVGLGDCYLPPTTWTIEPGERLPIHGLLLTTPDGATRGAVEFARPAAVAIDKDGTRTALDPDTYEVAPQPFGFDYSVDTSVPAPLQHWSAADWARFGGWLTVGLVEGALEWIVSTARGIVEILALVTDWRNLAAGGTWLAENLLKASGVLVDFWFLMTPAQKALFAADVGLEVYRLAIEAGETIADAEARKQAAEAILPGWFDQVEQAYATNDPALMGQAWGRVSGNAGLEVISCVLPSPKWMGEYSRLAARHADELSAAAETSATLAKAGSTSAVKQTARREVPNGAFVGPALTSKLWGLSASTLSALVRFADENKLLITIRDRSSASIARLAEGFIEKMEYMKLKSVRMDVDGPLGYRASHADIVAFKRPIPENELESVLAGISNVDLRNEVRARWVKRAKEWDDWQDIYRVWERDGFPSGFQYGPNGAVGTNDRSRLPFRLDPVIDPVTGQPIPDYFVPQVFQNGEWRGFTGDIDIVDIRHASGRSLSPADARWVYDQLKDLPEVSLRHGDTIHWIDGGPGLSPDALHAIKVGQLEDYFVGGPDKLVQLAPDGARAVQLDPEKTFVAAQRAGEPSRSTYATYAGGYQQTVTTVDIGRHVIELSADGLNPFLPWLAPADWILPGATPEQPLGACTAVASASDGFILRPGEAGTGLEVYRDGAWETYDATQCAAVQIERMPGSFALVPAPTATAPIAAATGPVRESPTIAYAPQSALAAAAGAGDDRLEIHDLPTIFTDEYLGDWFAVGDEILVAPGTDREERHTVAGFGSLVLAEPLAHDHDAETMVVVVHRSDAGEPDDPGTPGGPDDPGTPGGPDDPGEPGSPGPSGDPGTAGDPDPSGTPAIAGHAAGDGTVDDPGGESGTGPGPSGSLPFTGGGGVGLVWIAFLVLGAGVAALLRGGRGGWPEGAPRRG